MITGSTIRDSIGDKWDQCEPLIKKPFLVLIPKVKRQSIVEKAPIDSLKEYPSSFALFITNFNKES
tara:strand:- start:40 stop:237 length:198 start_codon:yes stop_codon:yes gene_type:complete